MRPIGISVISLLLVAACATEQAAVTLPMPTPERGQMSIVAKVLEPLGDVQPIAVAMTNGRAGTVRLDPTQAFARGASEARTAPFPPGEAARQAGGQTLPGAVKEGAIGAARGGAMGAIGSALSDLILGAVSGGIGLGAAAGAAVGGLFGAISGASSGGGTPDVAGFEERALHAAVLAPTFSATGYLYYPPGDYQTLEILLVGDDGVVEPVVVSLTPARD
jgi:hypothetical protein